MGEGEFLVFIFYCVFGFWLYVLSKDFRSKVHEVWRSRSGLRRVRTVAEISVALLCGFGILIGPLALIGLVLLAR